MILETAHACHRRCLARVPIRANRCAVSVCSQRYRPEAGDTGTVAGAYGETRHVSITNSRSRDAADGVPLLQRKGHRHAREGSHGDVRLALPSLRSNVDDRECGHTANALDVALGRLIARRPSGASMSPFGMKVEGLQHLVARAGTVGGAVCVDEARPKRAYVGGLTANRGARSTWNLADTASRSVDNGGSHAACAPREPQHSVVWRRGDYSALAVRTCRRNRHPVGRSAARRRNARSARSRHDLAR